MAVYPLGPWAGRCADPRPVLRGIEAGGGVAGLPVAVRGDAGSPQGDQTSRVPPGDRQGHSCSNFIFHRSSDLGRCASMGLILCMHHAHNDIQGEDTLNVVWDLHQATRNLQHWCTTRSTCNRVCRKSLGNSGPSGARQLAAVRGHQEYVGVAQGCSLYYSQHYQQELSVGGLSPPR